MAVPVRSNKPNGSKSWATNDVATAAGLNGDIDNIITEMNGNLDTDNLAAGAVDTDELAAGAVTNAKVDASAAIAFSKMDQTVAGALDSDVIDDYSDNAATARTATDPGDSETPSLATTLDGELERLRYAIKRLALGVNADLIDGTNPATWYDGSALGPNLIRNGAFLDPATLTPAEWTITGTLNRSRTALAVAEGSGTSLHFTDATGATTDGAAQSLALRASTLYLVEARVLPATANVVLTTTGADAATVYDDLALTSSGTSWQTLTGLIKTDATPTAIVVNINPSATNYDFSISWVSVREVSQADASVRSSSELTQYASSTSGTEATVEAALAINVVAPGPGYKIIARAIVNATVGGSSGTDVLELDLQENAGSVAKSDIADGDGSGSDIRGVIVSEYVNDAPVPGTTYAYTVVLTATNTAAPTSGMTHSLTVQLVKS